MITQILLDMDGVLADFMQGALALHKTPDLFNLLSSKGRWDTEKLLGISPAQFWKPIDTDPTFWESLTKTEEADSFVSMVQEEVGEENVAILTAPSLSPECFTGKRKWIEHHFPQFSHRIIYGRAKGFLASPTRLLVDDKPENCEAFQKAGGQAILVPRPWNVDWKWAGIAGGMVRQRLEALRHQ